MSQSKIITVTLNPSLDETITVNHLNLGYHNLTADTMRLDASGRGVNVSHALSLLEVDTHALVFLGSDAMGHAYKGLLTEQPFGSTIIRHPGHTRSDTILFDKGEDVETHVIDEGTGATDIGVEHVIDKLRVIANPQDTVVLAGKLPRDIHADTYARIATVADELGARVVVMTGHESLDITLKAKPELVALTRLETESYLNYPVRTFADMVIGGEKLLEKGAQQVVIINDNFDGAIFVNAEEKLMAMMDTGNTGTNSGVADSMVAGYLAGIQRGMNTASAFELGAAAVVFASNRVGNNFGTYNDLEGLFDHIDIRIFDPSMKM